MARPASQRDRSQLQAVQQMGGLDARCADHIDRVSSIARSVNAPCDDFAAAG